MVKKILIQFNTLSNVVFPIFSITIMGNTIQLIDWAKARKLDLMSIGKITSFVWIFLS